MEAKQLKCGIKVRTAKGWFNVIRVWTRGGKTSKVDLTVNGREVPSVNAEELCKHILEWDII
jgi:predicted SpoU family rRNA methylase